MHKTSIRYITLRLSLRLSTGIGHSHSHRHSPYAYQSQIQDFPKGVPFSVKDVADCNYWVVGPTAHIG